MEIVINLQPVMPVGSRSIKTQLTLVANHERTSICPSHRRI